MKLSFAAMAVFAALATPRVGAQIPETADIRVEYSAETESITIVAHHASRREVLEALADRARFTLRISANLSDQRIDYQAANAPLARIVDDILRGTGIGYGMLLRRHDAGGANLLIVGPAAGNAPSNQAVRAKADTTPGDAVRPNGDTTTATVTAPADLQDPIVVERFEREIAGPGLDEMLAAAGNSRPINSRAAAPPRRADSPVLSSPVPGRVPAGAAPLPAAAPFAPVQMAAPNAAPWRSISADEVNGKKK